MRDQVIREHALKNLYGFEYLIAPYTIAHLKLSQFLHDKGYTMLPKERLQIYLTNTLEPIEPQPNFLLPALSKEVEQAQEIKEKPILVITGNPPYSGHSLNKGEWITGLIETYKRVDGNPLGEKNPKWLQDDYVKFIRFAQWKMDQVDEGIVGIITNHSFLDNPTFRGMRQSLMQTFNLIYVLDLHGNNKKKEIAPDGNKDDNVFDIEQGVCISLLVRNKERTRKIFHASFWGKRQDKYRACAESYFAKVPWVELQPNSPNYLFIPQNIEARSEYEKGWKIQDILNLNSNGFFTARDNLTVGFSATEIIERIHKFSSMQPEDARREYSLGEDVRDWQVALAQKDVSDHKANKSNITQITYRPFDDRYTFYTGRTRGFMCMPRNEIMRHLLKQNFSLCIGRQFASVGSETYDIVFVSNKPVDLNFYRRGGEAVFPIYLYNFSDDKKHKDGLLDEVDPFDGKDRIENFKKEFREFIYNKYDHAYDPEDIIGYIYAVLYSPAYRRKYAEFLKIDFPRIPFVDDRKIFEKLSKLGWGLVQAHLLKEIPATPKVEVTKGSDLVEKPVYGASNQRLYINTTQYFAPVQEDVWNFHIGGYQVLDKYLKSRKGRELSLDEKENIINVVKVLRFTIDQMEKIDQAFVCP